VHGNELSGSQGEIASPLFPHSYFRLYRRDDPADATTWRVTVGDGMAVALEFQVFEVEANSYSGECRARLAVIEAN